MQQDSVGKIIQVLERTSLIPLQNRERIKRFIFVALAQGTPITFFDWECPPRALSATNDGRSFVNYDVDLDRIFHGEIIDKYTELPRAVSQKDVEVQTLVFLKRLGIPFRFVKIIADTNAYYITPESVARIGQERIERVFEEFRNRLKAATRNYPVDVAVYRFSEIIRPFRTLYDGAFAGALEMLTTESDALVSSAVINQQIERTMEHVGIRDIKQAKKIAQRVIATYGAEGIVLEALSQTKALSNCVWMNLREIDERTIEITNCLRKLRGQEPLPMWFPKF